MPARVVHFKYNKQSAAVVALSLEEMMEKRTVFNQNNTGHLTKTYPIFFGEDLGMYDSVNIINKRIEQLKELQRSMAWYPTEVSMSQDRLDMQRTDRDTSELMVKTIMWQSMTDSIASRSIAALMSPHVTNSEADCMISEWSRMEFIHSEAYLHIIKQVMPNPDEVLLEAYRDLKIRARSQTLIEVFDDIYNMTHNTPLQEKKERMAVFLATLMFMEGVSFMSSFAVTFAIAETGVFQGISETVSMIAKDEITHSLMSYELIRACRDDDGWGEVFKKVKPKIKGIFDELVKSEEEWTDYLFSNGRNVVGLNAETLKGCVHYYAQTCYNIMGLEAPFSPVEENPCSYMSNYLDRSLTQYAPQEIQHGSYRQGSIQDDVEDDADLDFDF